MIQETQLRERCREALELTKKHGADDVEIYAEASTAISTEIEKQDLQMSSSRQETMIGIRAIVDHRIGFASTNALEDLEATCTDAVKLAKASPSNEHNVLPEPRPVEALSELFDPQAEAFSVSDAVRHAIQIIELAEKKDPRLVLGNGEFSVDMTGRCLVTSRGIDLFERNSLFLYNALATAKDGDVVSNMAFGFDAVHSVDAIDIQAIVDKACDDALGSLGATSGESFAGPVLLAPQAVQAVLAGFLSFQLNGKNVLRGSSRWGKMLGNAVAHPSLTVVDDGRLSGGAMSGAFDREGAPRQRFVLIDKGEAQGLMHNTFTAHAMGTTSTGHASGSARALPGIGPSNFMILPGDQSKADLVAGMKQGLLVNRFAGSSNPISGDFSGVAKAAYLIKDGKIDRPVTGTLIAGNAFEMVKTLSGISSETERVFTAILPYIRLEGVSVTAE